VPDLPRHQAANFLAVLGGVEPLGERDALARGEWTPQAGLLVEDCLEAFLFGEAKRAILDLGMGATTSYVRGPG
jgi:hypothetical protein